MQKTTDYFKRESENKVFLEEENHIYIDKKTGQFYNSVTGVFSLIKKEFDGDDAISGIQRQYKKFIDWFSYNKINENHLIEYLSLYVNYRQFTDKCLKTYQGKTYEGYVHDLRDYASVEEFYTEYKFLEHSMHDQLKRKKNIYLNANFEVMSKESILEMWKDMTDIANHYGNIVHITLEREILSFQNLLDHTDDHLMIMIQEHYFWIKNHLPSFYEKYPNSKHSFVEYEIDCTLGELMDHIIFEFYKKRQFKGLCIVPEKRLLYRGLSGTKDVHELISDDVFDTGDHKTNKDFTIESKYEEYFLPPFDNYQVTDLNKFTFQLSMYSYMEEQLTNKKLRSQYITYYNRAKEKFSYFNIEYRKDEAEALIQIYVEWIEKWKTNLLKSSLGKLIQDQIKPIWMDHFTKGMYYYIQDCKKKNLTDVELYKKYILDYRKKHINITYNGN